MLVSMRQLESILYSATRCANFNNQIQFSCVLSDFYNQTKLHKGICKQWTDYWTRLLDSPLT